MLRHHASTEIRAATQTAHKLRIESKVSPRPGGFVGS